MNKYALDEVSMTVIIKGFVHILLLSTLTEIMILDMERFLCQQSYDYYLSYIKSIRHFRFQAKRGLYSFYDMCFYFSFWVFVFVHCTRFRPFRIR